MTWRDQAFVTVSQLAQAAGLPVSEVRKAIRNGELRVNRERPPHLRIPIDSALSFVDEGEVVTPDPLRPDVMAFLAKIAPRA